MIPEFISELNIFLTNDNMVGRKHKNTVEVDTEQYGKITVKANNDGTPDSRSLTHKLAWLRKQQGAKKKQEPEKEEEEESSIQQVANRLQEQTIQDDDSEDDSDSDFSDSDSDEEMEELVISKRKPKSTPKPTPKPKTPKVDIPQQQAPIINLPNQTPVPIGEPEYVKDLKKEVGKLQKQIMKMRYKSSKKMDRINENISSQKEADILKANALKQSLGLIRF